MPQGYSPYMPQGYAPQGYMPQHGYPPQQYPPQQPYPPVHQNAPNESPIPYNEAEYSLPYCIVC